MNKGFTLKSNVYATIIKMLDKKFSFQEMIDAFGVSEHSIYVYKRRKIHEDFIEEHEQNIKGFVQDEQDRLYIKESSSDSFGDILETRENMLHDIVEYSEFYISKQAEEHYYNQHTKFIEHRKGIRDKSYITFISAEEGEVTLTHRKYGNFSQKKVMAKIYHERINSPFKEIFNIRLGENESRTGEIYDILLYDSNLRKTLQHRDSLVIETVYKNVWNSGNYQNPMKNINYVINMFRKFGEIRKITNEEWISISKNINEIEIDKYHNKKDFIELIKSLGLNKKSIIQKPTKKPLIQKPTKKPIILKSKYDGIGLEATSNKTSYESIISNPVENDKYESPKPMENNLESFIKRIREFDRFYGKHRNSQSIYEMTRFEKLYENIKSNKNVEDRVVQILSSEISLYGVNNKNVTSYVDDLNKMFDNIRVLSRSLEKDSESFMLESIEYNLTLHMYSNLRLW